jgi:hypothetical protein
MTDYPDPIQLRTNADWRDVIVLQTDDGSGPVDWSIPAGTPLRMQIREKACSPYVEMELSTANGKLIRSAEGYLAFNVEDTEIAARLGPRSCDEVERLFEADLVAVIDGLDVEIMRRSISVTQGVTQK